MPFVNVKILENQFDESKKQKLISDLTELIVGVMNREKTLTTIVIDEIKGSSWAIGGKAITPETSVSFVNIKVSKGTTNAEEMALMQKKTKELMSQLLNIHVDENYFIIDELNPAGWGFGDITMAERN
jgi:4-oxalocrotonate tautomerase